VHHSSAVSSAACCRQAADVQGGLGSKVTCKPVGYFGIGPLVLASQLQLQLQHAPSTPRALSMVVVKPQWLESWLVLTVQSGVHWGLGQLAGLTSVVVSMWCVPPNVCVEAGLVKGGVV
jgi:hypothetical protein